MDPKGFVWLYEREEGDGSSNPLLLLQKKKKIALLKPSWIRESLVLGVGVAKRKARQQEGDQIVGAAIVLFEPTWIQNFSLLGGQD